MDGKKERGMTERPQSTFNLQLCPHSQNFTMWKTDETELPCCIFLQPWITPINGRHWLRIYLEIHCRQRLFILVLLSCKQHQCNTCMGLWYIITSAIKIQRAIETPLLECSGFGTLQQTSLKESSWLPSTVQNSRYHSQNHYSSKEYSMLCIGSSWQHLNGFSVGELVGPPDTRNQHRINYYPLFSS